MHSFFFACRWNVTRKYLNTFIVKIQFYASLKLKMTKCNFFFLCVRVKFLSGFEFDFRCLWNVLPVTCEATLNKDVQACRPRFPPSEGKRRSQPRNVVHTFSNCSIWCHSPVIVCRLQRGLVCMSPERRVCVLHRLSSAFGRVEDLMAFSSFLQQSHLHAV